MEVGAIRRDQFAGTVGSAADFERADEDIDLNDIAADAYKSRENSSDSDDIGSHYMPTAIARAAPKANPVPRQPRSKTRDAEKDSGAGGVEMTGSGGKLSGGSRQHSLPPNRPKTGTTAAGGPSSPLGRGLVGKGSNETSPVFQAKTRPLDTKGGIQFDIEAERDKIKQMEDRYRQELDKLRNEQASAIGELEANHIIAKK